MRWLPDAVVQFWSLWLRSGANTFTTLVAGLALNGLLKIICTHLVPLVGPYITSKSVVIRLLKRRLSTNYTDQDGATGPPIFSVRCNILKLNYNRATTI